MPRVRVDTFMKSGFRYLEDDNEVSGRLRHQMNDEEQDLYYYIGRGGFQVREEGDNGLYDD